MQLDQHHIYIISLVSNLVVRTEHFNILYGICYTIYYKI